MHIIHGQPREQHLANRLSTALSKLDLDGTLYLGYPILASADEPIAVDALLLTKNHGLVVFVFDRAVHTPQSSDDWTQIKDQQDAIIFSLRSNLSRSRALRKGPDLAFRITAITVLPTSVSPPPEFLELGIITPEDPAPALDRLSSPIGAEYWEAVIAAVQKVTTIKPRKKRADVKKPHSHGAILKEIEAEIANLDRWQQGAAIESPEGPQRIRGLAGSGKTVVLALKAAYLHAQHPEWRIAITFYSRSLYQQLKDLIRRFSFEHLNDEPDWDRIQILHSWGGHGRAGLYTTMASHANSIIRDWQYAKAQYGSTNAFKGICAELLAVVSSDAPEPIFDAILIDEAQDLPREFFRLIHAYAKPPKRIVWAYDELQNLSEAAMPTTAEMFGTNADGSPRVILESNNEGPRQDIVLPVCYRNTPWALTLAHALGFGIYRDEGLVQHFDDPQLWHDIGYQVLSGNLALGSTVRLKRGIKSYPSYFPNLLTPTDAIITNVSPDSNDQDQWVASEIDRNLKDDELEHDDILLIFANPLTTRKRAPSIMRALQRRGIESHLVGETTSSDEIFVSGSVAITHIYRAKGNEAPMVYILDSHACAEGRELIKLRNMLFTAVTRSRAWIRICGFGLGMMSFAKEIDATISNDYELNFKIPTPEGLERMRRIHRDLSDAEKKKHREAQKGLEQFLKALETGDIDIESLPSEVRTKLKRLGVDSPGSEIE